MRRAVPPCSALSLALALACSHAPTAKQREAAEIHYQLGVEALEGGRTEEALREFDQSLKLNDRFPSAYLGRGLAAQFLQRPGEAELDYRRAIALDPQFSEAHNALGQLLAQTGRLAQAIPEFDLALGNLLYREAYVARCNRGDALYQLGRREEGLAELRTCLKLSPRYCRAHREIGRFELEEGKVQEALRSLRRYAELCPKQPDAWLQVGLAETKAGDTEKARESFEQCAKLGGDEAAAEECKRRGEALR